MNENCNVPAMRYIFFAVILIGFGFLSYQVFLIKQKLETKEVIKPDNLEKNIIKEVLKQEEVIQKDKKLAWKEIQNMLKDSVVQVINQATDFNWIEPYKSPSQKESSGSAFFINDSDSAETIYLMTNAHVVDQSKIIYIQLPNISKDRFDVTLVAVSPDRDLALLRLTDDSLQKIKQGLGVSKIPYLNFGDSNTVSRADKLMTLGYPLGQQKLKSTSGIVSGQEHLGGQHFIQIDAPINPGNSGGPAINSEGEVIGINSAAIPNAQNVGYIIPINEVKLFLKHVKLHQKDNNEPIVLKKPYLGVLFSNSSTSVAEFLGNPAPGGLYVSEVFKNSPFEHAGIKTGDVVYSLNGIAVDIYGEMKVKWSMDDKINIVDYVSTLTIGDEIKVDYYRKGQHMKTSFAFSENTPPGIRKMNPGYETIDYEVIGGLTIMPLTLNHIVILAQFVPEIVQYANMNKHTDPLLLITNVFINSTASRARVLGTGMIISEVNDEKVNTLDDFRRVVLKSADSGYLTIKTTDSLFAAMPVKEIIADEQRLASIYLYKISNTFNKLKAYYEARFKN